MSRKGWHRTGESIACGKQQRLSKICNIPNSMKTSHRTQQPPGSCRNQSRKMNRGETAMEDAGKNDRRKWTVERVHVAAQVHKYAAERSDGRPASRKNTRGV